MFALLIKVNFLTHELEYVIRLNYDAQRMKYSLRTLMAIVPACAVLIISWQWYANLTPNGFGTWFNQATELGQDGKAGVPRYYFGGFESNGKHFAGFLVRIDDPKFQHPQKQWLASDNGRISVMGQRILPLPRYQLFISTNDSEPKRILLENDDAIIFRSMRGGVADWERFWLSLHDKQKSH